MLEFYNADDYKRNSYKKADSQTQKKTSQKYKTGLTGNVKQRRYPMMIRMQGITNVMI